MAMCILPAIKQMDEPIVSTEPVVTTEPVITTDSIMIEEVPSVLRLDELLNDYEVLVQQENSFKTYLADTLLNMNLTTIRPILLQWIASGYPDSYRILTIQVPLPATTCSDGVARNMYEFISFCANMPFTDIMIALQDRLIGIKVGYITEGRTFSIVVSKV